MRPRGCFVMLLLLSLFGLATATCDNSTCVFGDCTLVLGQEECSCGVAFCGPYCNWLRSDFYPVLNGYRIATMIVFGGLLIVCSFFAVQQLIQCDKWCRDPSNRAVGFRPGRFTGLCFVWLAIAARFAYSYDQYGYLGVYGLEADLGFVLVGFICTSSAYALTLRTFLLVQARYTPTSARWLWVLNILLVGVWVATVAALIVGFGFNYQRSISDGETIGYGALIVFFLLFWLELLVFTCRVLSPIFASHPSFTPSVSVSASYAAPGATGAGARATPDSSALAERRLQALLNLRQVVRGLIVLITTHLVFWVIVLIFKTPYIDPVNFVWTQSLLSTALFNSLAFLTWQLGRRRGSELDRSRDEAREPSLPSQSLETSDTQLLEAESVLRTGPDLLDPRQAAMIPGPNRDRHVLPLSFAPAAPTFTTVANADSVRVHIQQAP